MKSPLTLALVLVFGACTSNEATSSTALEQEPGNCGSLETHVFGAYRSPDGRMTVPIDRVGTHAIVVTAHDKTTWKITAAPGAEIEAIYAVGVHEQTIAGPSGVTAVSESGDDSGPSVCAYGWPDSAGRAATRRTCWISSSIASTRSRASTRVTRRPPGCSAATCYCSVYVGSAQKDMVKGCDGEESCGGPIFL